VSKATSTAISFTARGLCSSSSSRGSRGIGSVGDRGIGSVGNRGVYNRGRGMGSSTAISFKARRLWQQGHKPI
jgi:hypothetical protein